VCISSHIEHPGPILSAMSFFVQNYLCSNVRLAYIILEVDAIIEVATPKYIVVRFQIATFAKVNFLADFGVI
jgi:hypothetical protein